MRGYGFILCAGLLACGGRSRSTDAGPASAPTASGGSAGVPTASGGSAGAPTASGGSGAGSNAGGASGAPPFDCLQEGTYGALAGPFADPGTVWARISGVVSGTVLEPPSPLPAEASEDWAGQIALEALDRELESGTLAGSRRFLETWIGLPAEPSPIRSVNWGAVIAQQDATLETLLAFSSSDPVRTGVFTDLEWLSLHPSIDHRGRIMLGALFGMQAPLPPPGIPPQEPDPGLTLRETHEASIAAAPCQPCHALFDPLGFSLEHFDRLGDYRDTDNGQAVDSSGTLVLDGEQVPFSSITDLAPRLAMSCEVRKAVSEHFFMDALAASGVIAPGAEPPYPRDLVQVSYRFVDSGGSFRKLLEATAKGEAMLR